jgi:hypothetical protein
MHSSWQILPKSEMGVDQNGFQMEYLKQARVFRTLRNKRALKLSDEKQKIHPGPDWPIECIGRCPSAPPEI